MINRVSGDYGLNGSGLEQREHYPCKWFHLIPIRYLPIALGQANHSIQLTRSGHGCWAKSQPAARYLEKMVFPDASGTSRVHRHSLFALSGFSRPPVTECQKCQKPLGATLLALLALRALGGIYTAQAWQQV